MTAIDLNDFLFTGNQTYIAEMFERFLDDPGAVEKDWQNFFSGLDGDMHEDAGKTGPAHPLSLKNGDRPQFS